MSADSPIRSLVVASGNPSEVKATVCVSLAIAFAQSGKKVLLVDPDLRRPRLHRVLGVTLAVIDAAVLAPQLDDVVIEAESTTRDALLSALRQLKDVGATVRGVVVNDVDVSQKGYGRSGYTYYDRDGDHGTPETAPGEAPSRSNAN